VSEAPSAALVAAARAGDAGARARLVESYMPLIASTARIYRTGQVQRVELLQGGRRGLLRPIHERGAGACQTFKGPDDDSTHPASVDGVLDALVARCSGGVYRPPPRR